MLLALGLYAFAGVYQVDQQERGVVFRFGKVLQNEVGPGLHWNPPLIDQVDIVNVTQVQSHSHQALMLTEDENIVDVSLTVQWVIDSAPNFLINVREPRDSLAQATESALRHVAGSASMDEVITDGREAMAIEVQERLQSYLRSYGAGIDVTKVNIDRSAPQYRCRMLLTTFKRPRKISKVHQPGHRLRPASRARSARAEPSVN